MQTKTCPRCDQTKPLDGFQKKASRVDGRSGWCKVCMRDATKTWKEHHNDLVRAHAKIYYHNLKLRKRDGT